MAAIEPHWLTGEWPNVESWKQGMTFNEFKELHLTRYTAKDARLDTHPIVLDFIELREVARIGEAQKETFARKVKREFPVCAACPNAKVVVEEDFATRTFRADCVKLWCDRRETVEVTPLEVSAIRLEEAVEEKKPDVPATAVDAW